MFFSLPSPLHFFFGSFLAYLPFVFPLSSFVLPGAGGRRLCRAYQDSHEARRWSICTWKNHLAQFDFRYFRASPSLPTIHSFWFCLFNVFFEATLAIPMASKTISTQTAIRRWCDSSFWSRVLRRIDPWCRMPVLIEADNNNDTRIISIISSARLSWLQFPIRPGWGGLSQKLGQNWGKHQASKLNTKCQEHPCLYNQSHVYFVFLALGLSKNYFTSCDPHHDIYTFCYWQIFWHSIWRYISSGILSGISSGILSGISSGILTAQIFWHSIWQTFWHFIWHIFWHSIWHFIWHSIWHTFLHSIWQIFWHSIWHFIWHSIWHTFLHSIWQIFWHSIWHIFWHSIWPLRLSGAHWAGKVPGWGPAVRTELGRSQVEVQRCALSWEGPRLRSSSAHWARKLAKSLAKSWQGGSGGGSWCRHGRGETGGGGGGWGERGGGGGGQQLW